VTKTSILTEIYNSSEVAKVIQTLKPVHLQQDILQHCFLELFEKSEEFIIDLYQRNKLTHYIVKVLYNTSKFTRSTFAKEQNSKEVLFSDLSLTRNTAEHSDTLDEFESDEEHHQALIDYQKEQEDDYKEVFVNMNSMHWYRSEILKLYAGVKDCKGCHNLISTEAEKCLLCHRKNDKVFKCGTYQSISDLTGIPLTSIYNTIQDAKKENRDIFFDIGHKKKVNKFIMQQYYKHVAKTEDLLKHHNLRKTE